MTFASPSSTLSEPPKIYDQVSVRCSRQLIIVQILPPRSFLMFTLRLHHDHRLLGVVFQLLSYFATLPSSSRTSASCPKISAW